MSDNSIPDDFTHEDLTSDQLEKEETLLQADAEDQGLTIHPDRIDQGGGLWTLKVTYERAAAGGGNPPPSDAAVVTSPAAGDQQAKENADFEKLMALREGYRKDVYRDSRGLPTVGIGHLMVPGDGLKFGDVISATQVDSFFKQDGDAALKAARSQAADAGITQSAFIPYLASANFQLGTAWTKKFPNTWIMIVAGQYKQAADALNGTLWAKQTPVRVHDFQNALNALPPKT